MAPSMTGWLLATALLASPILAHEHHEDQIPEGEVVSPEPIDTTLWIHILLQILAWGIIFPTGMVLGIVRSRLHVPSQILGTAVALVGYFLGHSHGGRQFKHNVHASFAPTIGFSLAAQVMMGIYLKLHIERGVFGKTRPWVVLAHGILGKAMPLLAWVQMLFGGITAMGYCQDDHMGQCLAHFIMGSAFIAYGIMLMILLLVGQAWLRRTGRSQEFFDSAVIAAWGCVNTFTEHRWGQDWRANDLQHTSMGIVWWCAGLLGLWLSRGARDGRPKRNIMPALVILLTGWAMGGHHQSLELSTHVHAVFGYTLMAAGMARIIEIAFVLKDQHVIDNRRIWETNSFQYLTPFLLVASGFLFMGATEEQMMLLSSLKVTHVSYILLLYSVAFLLFLFVNVLLHLYASQTWPDGPEEELPATEAAGAIALGNGTANGHAAGGLTKSQRQGLRDAEEFELEGLISGDEASDGGSGSGRKKERVNRDAV